MCVCVCGVHSDMWGVRGVTFIYCIHLCQLVKHAVLILVGEMGRHRNDRCDDDSDADVDEYPII